MTLPYALSSDCPSEIISSIQTYCPQKGTRRIRSHHALRPKSWKRRTNNAGKGTINSATGSRTMEGAIPQKTATRSREMKIEKTMQRNICISFLPERPWKIEKEQNVDMKLLIVASIVYPLLARSLGDGKP